MPFGDRAHYDLLPMDTFNLISATLQHAVPLQLPIAFLWSMGHGAWSGTLLFVSPARIKKEDCPRRDGVLHLENFSANI